MSELQLALDCPGDDGFHLRVQADLPLAGVTAVHGPSGSGKTTLLHCIAGLRRASAGSRILFADTPWQGERQYLPSWRRDIGFVFQDARLFPHLDVAGNLDFGARRRGAGPVTREAVIRWFDLESLLARSVNTLSAGQAQRVAIGRALLAAPRLLLLDEPLANLDAASRQRCVSGLQQAVTEGGIPMLYVSHDVEEVCQLADRMLLLEQGEVVASGSLLDLCSRIDTPLAHEERAAAVVEAELASQDEEYGLSGLRIAGQTLWVNRLEGAPGQRRRLRIPARDVSLCRSYPQDSSILNILPVTVAELERSGDTRVLLRLALGDQYLLARITRRSAAQLALAPGDALYAQVKSAALLSEDLP